MFNYLLTSWQEVFLMKANKHNLNEDDVLVDLVDQAAPLAPQDPEHPKDKTQQGQEPQL